MLRAEPQHPRGWTFQPCCMALGHISLDTRTCCISSWVVVSDLLQRHTSQDFTTAELMVASISGAKGG
jgi:hypothetical protein